MRNKNIFTGFKCPECGAQNQFQSETEYDFLLHDEACPLKNIVDPLTNEFHSKIITRDIKERVFSFLEGKDYSYIAPGSSIILIKQEPKK